MVADDVMPIDIAETDARVYARANMNVKVCAQKPKKKRGIINSFLRGRKTKAAEEEEEAVSYTHLRAHETDQYLVCRLLLEKKKLLIL